MILKELSRNVFHCSVINVLCCLRQLLYFISLFLVCQELFYFFSSFLKHPFRCPTVLVLPKRNFVIIPKAFLFVNMFFRLFSIFFNLLFQTVSVFDSSFIIAPWSWIVNSFFNFFIFSNNSVYFKMNYKYFCFSYTLRVHVSYIAAKTKRKLAAKRCIIWYSFSITQKETMSTDIVLFPSDILD